MQEKQIEDKKEEKDALSTSTGKPAEQLEPLVEKTEVKNANAAGQGAIGRTGEKPGSDMNENTHY